MQLRGVQQLQGARGYATRSDPSDQGKKSNRISTESECEEGSYGWLQLQEESVPEEVLRVLRGLGVLWR